MENYLENRNDDKYDDALNVNELLTSNEILDDIKLFDSTV